VECFGYGQGFSNINTFWGYSMHHTFFLPQKQNHPNALLGHPHHLFASHGTTSPLKKQRLASADGALHMQYIKL